MSSVVGRESENKLLPRDELKQLISSQENLLILLHGDFREQECRFKRRGVSIGIEVAIEKGSFLG